MTSRSRVWGWLAACVAIVIGCSEHDPELERQGGTGGNAGGAGTAGTSGGGQSGADGSACPPSTAAKPTFPCEVQAVLEAKCHRCHQKPPLNGSPFPLLTWEDTQVVYVGKPIFRRMNNAIKTDFMPATFVKLDPPVETLTPAEKQILIEWSECGIPADGAVCP
ncbi:MAG: hypothetical protein R3B13_07380 [Polyangiaceae bacterium]